MFVTFDQPAFLLLSLLIVPLLVIGWRSTLGMDRYRRYLAVSLRGLLTFSLCVMLSGPHWRQVHDHMTVIGLLDISGSVQRFANLPEIPELGDFDDVAHGLVAIGDEHESASGVGGKHRQPEPHGFGDVRSFVHGDVEVVIDVFLRFRRGGDGDRLAVKNDQTESIVGGLGLRGPPEPTQGRLRAAAGGGPGSVQWIRE